MTEKESKIARLKKCLEMQKYRQKKKDIPVQAATLTCVNAFGSKSSEAKAPKRVSKTLPKSPRKKRVVFQKFAVNLCPNQTEFKKNQI